MKTTLLGLAVAAVVAFSSNTASAFPVTVDTGPVALPSTSRVDVVIDNLRPARPGTGGTVTVSATGDFDGVDAPESLAFFLDGGPIFARLTASNSTVTMTPGAATNLFRTFSLTASQLNSILDNAQIAFGFRTNENVNGPTLVRATVSYNAVPEPATMTLLGLGAVVGCGAIRRRRKASAALAV